LACSHPDQELHTERTRRFSTLLQQGFGITGVGAVHKISHDLGCRHQLVQQLQSFGGKLPGEDGHACDVPTGSREARDHAAQNGVRAHEEDDWSYPARGLCCKHRVHIGCGKNRGNATADQIVRQRRQPIEMIFRRPILEDDVPALDMPGFSQAATKLGKFVTVGFEWRAAEQADHWQPLLCAHGERQ
jgi:hypothetical protein